jgi:hypothetical protein
VALPWVPSWRDLVDPLQELRDQLTRPAGELPRPVSGYLAVLEAIHAALHRALNPVLASSELRSPAVPGRPDQPPRPIADRAVSGRVAGA